MQGPAPSPPRPTLGARRCVAVTGAFGNLGLAVTRAFRERGEALTLIDYAQLPAHVAAEFGAPHCVLGGVDLTQTAAARTAMQTVREALGPIDVLVNIAGGFRWQTLEEGEVECWETTAVTGSLGEDS